ncbi:unnamed protein product [Phytomonas sp. EM1]|nr:unnamed protein product [Phytomonas sp. EM1]|eukprot:CCW62002.1 unnamed protein product [Phytomonas sp. isolate EM1]
MLGIRQLYPSSVVHAACILPLDDDLSHKTPSVLLAGTGFSVNVYHIEKRSPSSELTTISNEEKLSHDVIAFTPTGHSINIGSMVIRIAALRHQIAIFLTRDLELIVVRYQANLPWNLNEKNNVSCAQSLSHQHHWCILYRHTSFTSPFGTGARLALGEPMVDPKLIVGESGNTAQAIIFKNNVHTIHIEHLKSGSAVATAGLTFFGLIGRNRSSNFYHCAWFSEASMPSGEFRFRNHTKSESTYVYGETDDTRAQRLHEGWMRGSPSVADEDLMLDHSIKALSQKKRELEKMTPNLPTRDPRLPTVHISIGSLEADCLAPLPSPGVPTDCFVQLLTNRSSIYVSCLSMDYNSPLARPLVRTLSCLRVQTDSAGRSCSPYYIITAPPGPRSKVRTRAYALSSSTSGQYIHHWQISKATSTDLSVPQRGTRLTTSAERAVAGVFLFLSKLCSLWLLLDDGSLTEISDRTLTMLESDNVEDQMMGGTSWMHEEGQFNDCLDGAWNRCEISGLPRGFIPRGMQPFNHRSHTNPNPYIAVTQRYILLMDYICDAFVVDLQERCVVGGLLGEGAVTSVCRGPAHSIVVSHSKGTLTLLSPVVPAMISATRVLSATGEDPNKVAIPEQKPFLKTVLQGLYPIWRGCTGSEICNPLWGVLVCDVNHTYLLSCSDHNETGPLMLTEHRKQDGPPYWLSDEPTLYVASFTGINGGDLTLVQCTQTRLLVGHQIIDLPGKVTHAAGCRVGKVVSGVIHTVMLVAMILTDGLMLFSCSSACDSGMSPIVTTPAYQQTQPWPYPPASVAIDEINEEEVVVLIGMWDGCIDFIRLRATGGEGLWILTAVFHLDSPLCPSSISRFEDYGQLSIPRSIVRMRWSGEAHIQWMILHDNTHLTVIRYDTGGKGEDACKPKWESVTTVMPSCADLWGTGLSCVLRNSEDFSGFDLLLLQDEEMILLATGAEGDRNGGLSTSVRAVATMETTPLEFSSNGWQRGFVVQTRSSATGLLQHTLFLTDGHELVVASLPQLFRRSCCNSSSNTASLRTAQDQEDGGEKEHLAVVSPITYHLKRRVRVTSNPSQRLTKTLHLSSLGILMSILDCGEAQSSILLAMSETSFKVCDFLQLPNQVAICAAHVSPPPRQLEAFDVASEDIVLIGTAALEDSLGLGQVLVLLVHPLRIVHTAPVSEGAVMDLSVCRKASNRGEDSLHHDIIEDDAEILVAVCCGPLVCVYKLAGYALYPLTSHRFEVDCTSISLCQIFVSVGLGSLGNAFLQLVYPQNTSIARDCTGNAITDDTLLLEDTLSYASSSTVNGDSENGVLTDEAQTEAAGEMEGGRTHSGKDIAACLNDSATPKLRMVAREPTLGAGVFKQDTYRNRSVRVDDDGGVYISFLSSSGNRNFERCSQWTGAVGDCQVVMTHCWGLPSPASAVKVEVLMTTRAVAQSQPRRLHWCERSGVLLPACDDSVAIFFGCLDGSLFAAVELPYVFAFPLLRMEQVITDYYRNFESISIRNDVAYASYSATNKFQSCSLYSPFSSKLKRVNQVIPVPSAQYVYESVPFVASSALKAGTRVVMKKGAVWLDAVSEYFLLKRAVLGNAVRFEDLIPDVVERSRIEHKYHTLHNALINTLHEEYGNELSLMDCEEILNAW